MNSNNNIQDFQKQMKQKVQKIEDILQEYLPKQRGYQSVIMEAMGYSLLAGGKRLRPMLMQETFQLYDGTSKALRPFMAALEMIHTYSLVHDDLPAMGKWAMGKWANGQMGKWAKKRPGKGPGRKREPESAGAGQAPGKPETVRTTRRTRRCRP